LRRDLTPKRFSRQAQACAGARISRARGAPVVSAAVSSLAKGLGRHVGMSALPRGSAERVRRKGFDNRRIDFDASPSNF